LVSPYAVGSEGTSEEAGHLCPRHVLSGPEEFRTGECVSQSVVANYLGISAIPEPAFAPLPILRILIERSYRCTKTAIPAE
jgi:hypothetical protein